MLAGAVAGALYKVNAGNGRKATQVLHREYEGMLHQAMDQQLVRGGIDRWHTRVMTLEMQRGWSDHAVRVLERRPARARCGSAGYAECACGSFERGAFSISAARSTQQVGLGSLCSTRCRYHASRSGGQEPPTTPTPSHLASDTSLHSFTFRAAWKNPPPPTAPHAPALVEWGGHPLRALSLLRPRSAQPPIGRHSFRQPCNDASWGDDPSMRYPSFRQYSIPPIISLT